MSASSGTPHDDSNAKRYGVLTEHAYAVLDIQRVEVCPTFSWDKTDGMGNIYHIFVPNIELNAFD